MFVGRSSIGGPAAAIVVEEMAARGVRDFVTFGACGSLREELRIGSVVVPTFAYADEGTSRHYGAPRFPRPDPSLVTAIHSSCDRQGIPFVVGGVWTTDAPYRESRTVVRTLSRRGVVAADMEAASVYAVARSRKLRAASLMVVSDELGRDGWNPGFLDPRFRKAKLKAIPAVVEGFARS